jgi:hypothetical protein
MPLRKAYVTPQVSRYDQKLIDQVAKTSGAALKFKDLFDLAPSFQNVHPNELTVAGRGCKTGEIDGPLNRGFGNRSASEVPDAVPMHCKRPKIPAPGSAQILASLRAASAIASNGSRTKFVQEPGY